MGKCLKRHLYFFVITAIIFMLPEICLSSALNTLSDRMSRQAPLFSSNHEIKFITPSGVKEAGLTISINFDAGFNLAGIAYDDVDLFHGPATGFEVAESLVVMPSITQWGVSVLGDTLTLTHPTDSANGDILPNDMVVVRIGTNANGGNTQIINPGTIGSKVISINGSFGDFGKLAVAIFRDQIGINVGEPEGGGFPPPPLAPTLDLGPCPIFRSPKLLSGDKVSGVTIFINGSSEGVEYPTVISWTYLAYLNLRSNPYQIYSRDVYGQNSSLLNIDLVRWRVGDTNGNFIVDDFDLAGVAYHWDADWCFGDFNEDDIVDDFDLSGLAAHWDSIY
ncbi:hypothetical protein JW977_00420 [Candidatus Falkowbacteria bacterium]|nr:hypothetical protein [Candidatus Falkowbacteria bacterium]